MFLVSCNMKFRPFSKRSLELSLHDAITVLSLQTDIASSFELLDF